MKKIIVLALNMGIGNTLMITPMLKEIKKKFPLSEISVLVSNNSCYDVLSNNPYIKKVVVIRKER